MKKKIGIITFHNSHNCGSMLESYAILNTLESMYELVEIINFSNEGQKKLYNIFFENSSIKNLVKNIILIPHKKRLEHNFTKYEYFKTTFLTLSRRYSSIEELNEDNYLAIIAGSDQIWNITISDGDDAYFLPWVKKAKKIAYAPSFGSKNILDNTYNPEKYKKMINDFDALSIRENNGQKWIKDLCGKNAEALLDPTLLLNRKDYEFLEDNELKIDEKYIFFYSPGFDKKVCDFVSKISKKYSMKVITWSSKHYYLKRIKPYGFELPNYEDPSMYLSLIKNAELIITTSYHGTIFSTIYRKNFITVKNGGMYGDDDRVITLLSQIGMEKQLIPFEFDENYDYLKNVNYENYDKVLPLLKEKSLEYIKRNIKEFYDERRK